MSEKFFKFPEGFLWGAATAAYQIEGATHADGREDSIWDTFCRLPGVIEEGASGERACNHYEHWQKDIELMSAMGLQSYRFSTAWPRIIPKGRGAVNAKGLDFYDGLVDGLLGAKIIPNLTLYHWDLPQPLEDEGGWTNRATAEAFAEYASVVAKRLGDRVPMWSTFNEPWCVATLGYKVGNQAPGRKEGNKTYNQIIHNVLLAHGLGAQAIRRECKSARVGIVINPAIPWPTPGRPEDIKAADEHWQAENDWWMHPLMLGKYPEAVWKWKGADVPEIEAGDMETIQQPLDFVGLNFYFPTRVTADGNGTPLEPSVIPPDLKRTTHMPGWEVFPPIAEMLLCEFSRRYPRVPLYVTENGAAVDGEVHDPKRLAYIRDHLIHAKRAIDLGVDLKGWYVWSFMDNFEWRFGYGKRFGIHHVNYETFERTIKDSGIWYKEVIKNNGFSASDLPPVPTPFPKI